MISNLSGKISTGGGKVTGSDGTSLRTATWEMRRVKVVLFCGGMGYRMREHSSDIPKPLATIGVRPVLWHLMKYYCYFGHRDFVLCLGYKGEMIKEYFTNYNEWLSNDFVFSNGGRRVKLLAKDISEWQITFVDTGLRSSIGERFRRVRHLLADEDVFLANL